MNNSKILSVLKKARKLISKPEAWIKGVQAEDKNGNRESPLSKHAVAWCADGALQRAYGATDGGAYELAKQAVLDTTPKYRGLLCVWNDEKRRTHKQVLAKFDKAIAKLSKASA